MTESLSESSRCWAAEMEALVAREREFLVKINEVVAEKNKYKRKQHYRPPPGGFSAKGDMSNGSLCLALFSGSVLTYSGLLLSPNKVLYHLKLYQVSPTAVHLSLLTSR